MSVGRDGASDAVSFLARRRAGGRVRADRRRPPRPRGVGLGRLAAQLPPGARGLRQRLPRDGARVSPDEKTAAPSNGRGASEQPAPTRPRSTSSATTSPRTTTRPTRSSRTTSTSRDEDLDDEDAPTTRSSRTRTARSRGRGATSTRTTRTSSSSSISAETQEWDGLEAAEAEEARRTKTDDGAEAEGRGSSRPSRAGSPRASRRSAAAGEVTSGFKAGRRSGAPASRSGCGS